MNGTDLMFILLLLGGLALGFFQGTLKLVIAIIAFYVGIVLASLYFQPIGNFFRVRFNSSTEVGQITAFAVVLVVSFLLLTGAGLYTGLHGLAELLRHAVQQVCTCIHIQL